VAVECDRTPPVGFRETSADLARCIGCACALKGGSSCPACGRSYPEEGGILAAINPLTGRNRIAGAFYDGPRWPEFKRWERVFLAFQRAQGGARRQIIRHMPRLAQARLLEVGIGDGDNVPFLPAGWSIHGVDIARNRLVDCLDRYPAMRSRLVLAEAEALPFEDATFDVVFTVGGFNYFRDHAAALREMRRVAREGATLIVADEIPTLYRFAPGHFFGLEEVDGSVLRALGLDPEFVAMVLEHKLDIDVLARRQWPCHKRVHIWNRLGYCLVDIKE
jgi:SAM-dependent methyltransferase